MFCAMLTKFHYITNLKKWLQVGFRTLHFTEPPSPPLLIEVPGLDHVGTNDITTLHFFNTTFEPNDI
jgi:hypothetical protein